MTQNILTSIEDYLSWLEFFNRNIGCLHKIGVTSLVQKQQVSNLLH